MLLESSRAARSVACDRLFAGVEGFPPALTSLSLRHTTCQLVTLAAKIAGSEAAFAHCVVAADVSRDIRDGRDNLALRGGSGGGSQVGRGRRYGKGPPSG